MKLRNRLPRLSRKQKLIRNLLAAVICLFPVIRSLILPRKNKASSKCVRKKKDCS